MNNATTMPRKRITISVDTEIIKAIETLARKNNNSVSRFIESELLSTAIDKKELPEGYVPLGETRGRPAKN